MGGRQGVNSEVGSRSPFEASLTLTRWPKICFADTEAKKRGEKTNVFRNFQTPGGFRKSGEVSLAS
jgi:hypothetical protein